MTNPANLTAQAQQLVNAYDDAVELLEKWQELTDEQIDAMLWSEADLWKMLDWLILMKKIQADRRKIAEKEEEKCMTFITRIMKRLEVEDRSCEDWKASWKIVYRREYRDKEKKTVPLEYMWPVRWTINSAVQKWIKVEWIEVFEWNLAVQVR